MSQLPPGWAATTIGEVADLSSGFGFAKHLQGKQSGRFPFAKVGDISKAVRDNAGQLSVAANFVDDDDLKILRARPVPAGSTVFAKIGEALKLNRRALTTKPFVLDNNCMAASPKLCVEPGFLFLHFRTVDLSPFSVATTVPSVRKGDVESVGLGLPPLPEQRRIVAKVDSLSSKSKRAREHLDHIPRLVEKYKQAVLMAAFRGDLTREWRAKNNISAKYTGLAVGEVAEIVTGSTPPTKDSELYYGGNVPFIKPTDLDVGYKVLEGRTYLSEKGVARVRPVPSGSTLITCIGATIGKVGLARTRCCTNQQINALVPDLRRVNPEWLYWAASSPDFQASILDNASATTLPIINKGRLSRLPILVPSLRDQEEIVRRLESAFAWIDRLAAEAMSARKLIDRLDQAVLAKAFRGELVPQDPNDEPASVLLERIRAERETAPATKPRRGRAKRS